MDLWNNILTLLRSPHKISRIPSYVLEQIRRTIGLPGTDREHQEKRLQEGYNTYTGLIKDVENISQVNFRESQTIIVLKDGREYVYNPTNKASRMYDVPYTGSHEPRETEFIRNNLEAGQVTFDVGANFGWFTVVMSHVVREQGAVHAFEPIPDTFSYLQKNTHLNRCRNVFLNQMGLGKQNTSTTFFVPERAVSGLQMTSMFEGESKSYECQLITLDSYCEVNNIPHNSIDFIKADIEGGEFNMLQGATKVLDEAKPTLLLEVQERTASAFDYKPVEILTWLNKRGYKPYFLTSGAELEEIEDFSGPLPTHNIIFRPI